VADLDEVEDFLYDYLSEQLRVEAEDGSVQEVHFVRHQVDRWRCAAYTLTHAGGIHHCGSL